MRRFGLVTGVLAYFVGVAALHPLAFSWDALAFLMSARAGEVDYGHALYLPALRGAERLGALFALEPERSAQLFSAAGAALALVLLIRRGERGGLSRPVAAGVALLFAAGTLFWQESGSVEPSSWTIAALLVAGECAEAYGAELSLARLAALLLAFGAALGFHLVSVCALPWLAALVARGGRAPPRAHLAGAVLAGGFLVGLALAGGALARYLAYWSGFVPSYGASVLAVLGEHVQHAGAFLAAGAPVLLVAAGLAALSLPWSRARPRALLEAAALGAPYLLAFLLFGKPLVGLLLPVLLACALLVAAAAHSAPRARLLLAVALVAGLALVVPQALAWARDPGSERRWAELIARHRPADAEVIAGRLANHLRYYFPATPVVSLPEVWHQAFVEDRGVDPLAVVRRIAAGAARPCVLSQDAVRFLYELGADPMRLTSAEQAFIAPEDKRVALFPIAAEESAPPPGG